MKAVMRKGCAQGNYFVAKTGLVMALLLLVAGCASKVEYGEATAVETTTTGFGSTDLQKMAEKMVDSLLTFPPVVEITKKGRPVLFVEKIKNKTSEHIDTESITDTISTRLLRSGKFRFVDMTRVDEVYRQLDFQTDSGMVDPNTAVKIGKQIGAEYMLYGNLSSIVKRASDKKDVYYKFTMKLMHLETGLLEWSDEKEIRKTKGKTLFGM